MGAQLQFICTAKEERLRKDRKTDWLVRLRPEPAMTDGQAQYAAEEGGIELRVYDVRLAGLFTVGSSLVADFSFRA